MPDKPYKKNLKVSLHLSVDKDVKEQIEALAVLHGCSISQVGNNILKQGTGEYSPAWEKPQKGGE